MRAKPTFDLEERRYRLSLAAAVRELVDAARDGRALGDRVAAVKRRNMASLDPVLPPRQVARLAEWAECDEDGLARTLRSFSDAADDPEASVERFARAVETGPGPDRFLAKGLALASLLTFGMAPETRPIVPPAHYKRLQELLGSECAPAAGVSEDYRRDLAFARRVESALTEAGVPVRDMVDVESLITLCSLHHELWAGAGEESGSRRASEPEVYLAACAMYRNEANSLAEWIEFHRLVGVERFFLYDNDSDDGHREVLQPYVDEGIAVVHEWPGRAPTNQEIAALHASSYDHCLSTHGAEARWIAFIDTDEFLFSPTGRPLSEVLADYERWPAVVANWAAFGTSGHVTRPAGLVLENYHIRLDGKSAVLRRTGIVGRADQVFKSIVDPAAVTRSLGSHACEYRQGTAVDENGYPVSSRAIMTKSPSSARLRINHYFARSEADLRAKHERRTASRHQDVPPLPSSDELHQAHTAGVRDETILAHLPALRAALRRRAKGKLSSSRAAAPKSSSG